MEEEDLASPKEKHGPKTDSFSGLDLVWARTDDNKVVQYRMGYDAPATSPATSASVSA